MFQWGVKKNAAMPQVPKRRQRYHRHPPAKRPRMGVAQMLDVPEYHDLQAMDLHMQNAMVPMPHTRFQKFRAKYERKKERKQKSKHDGKKPKT